MLLSLQLLLITMAIPLMFLATLIEERSSRNEAMRILSGRLVTAQEEGRRHIARELHDEIGQILTVVKIHTSPGAGTDVRANFPTASA